jgi:nicotinamidase-related amidase
MTIATVIIDVQSGLFDSEPRPFDVCNVLQNINRVSRWARDSGYPVIYVQHEKPESILEYESEGWHLQADLIVEKSDIIVRKTTPDSFLKTNLEAVLKEHNVNHLVIVGYASEFCVDTTVRRSASLGYSVELISDAHTTHDKAHASGEAIRLHHNCTLPEVTSFEGAIALTQTNGLVGL